MITTIQETNGFELGDQITLGKYTAKCQEATTKAAVFLLDQWFDRLYRMNREDTNKGGYEASDLRKELQKAEVLSIFSPVHHLMLPFENGDLIRIPYLEEFYGSIMDHYEPSGKKQWPLMKVFRNRDACNSSNSEYSFWFQNKSTNSSGNFKLLGNHRFADSLPATAESKVRPVFQLRQPEPGEVIRIVNRKPTPKAWQTSSKLSSF